MTVPDFWGIIPFFSIISGIPFLKLAFASFSISSPGRETIRIRHMDGSRP